MFGRTLCILGCILLVLGATPAFAAWRIMIAGTSNREQTGSITTQVLPTTFPTKQACEATIVASMMSQILKPGAFEGGTVTTLPNFRFRVVWPNGEVGAFQYSCIPA